MYGVPKRTARSRSCLLAVGSSSTSINSTLDKIQKSPNHQGLQCSSYELLNSKDVTKIQQPLPTAKQLERWQSELEIVADAFSTPKTMYMVSKSTGVERPNVCRRVATLKEQGRIQVVRIDTDPMTQRRAQWFCTDKRTWPGYLSAGAQTNLFFS